MISRLVGALLLLQGCQQQRLVLEPGGDIDDVVAASVGIDRDYLRRGPWHFDAVELTVVLNSRRLHLPAANVYGVTVGDRLGLVSIIIKSDVATAAGALDLMQRQVALAAELGFTLDVPLPAAAELERMEKNDQTLHWSLGRDGEAKIAMGVTCTWLVAADESWAASELKFVPLDL